MKEVPDTAVLAARLLPWFRRHGRRHLPWQSDPTPYRVWISEVMLQQTQVETAIPYFQQFIERFPDVGSLAAASLDEVLHLWSGLGYYARARNLHRAANEIVLRRDRQIPETLVELMALPGVGRSTAGAVLALARGQRHAILDGNVKRVLARMFCIRDRPGNSETTARLWQLADQCTPTARVAEYTQAIMDLGATVCTRANPGCNHCPVSADCGALAANCVQELPARRIRGTRRLRQTQMVFVLRNGREVLLRKRAPQGIWGGLWVPPEFPRAAVARAWCGSTFGVATRQLQRLPVLRHSFTHFDLDIESWVLKLQHDNSRVEEPGSVWYTYDAPQSLGLPAPVSRLIEACFADDKNGSMRDARPRGGRPRPRALSG
ncbi:MAG: A/G-specific adenine glycosylase [Gammaproteobacteria bacterium]|nr:A/G-specific adenine glycosylase [Gammaproteobacteria bacterium]